MKRKKEKKLKEDQASFIDKYLRGDNYSDKFDAVRQPRQKNEVEKAYSLRNIRRALVITSCILLFCFGYFLMCIMMERNARPQPSAPEQTTTGLQSGGNVPNINDVNVDLSAKYISSDYLDGGTMVEAIIRDAVTEGYNAVLFDLKRPNGTLAYQSRLTDAVTFNAVASPGAKVKESVAMLLENNIIPLARIYCFSDNTAAGADSSMAVTKADGGLWKDSGGSAWLNPYDSYAVQYITSVILEVQDLGISSIILDGVSSPKGNLTGAVFSGSETNQVDDGVFDSFLSGMRTKVAAGTRLLVANNMTITGMDELPAVVAELAAQAQKGTVPVITLSIPAQSVAQALSQAKITHYIFVISPATEEESTQTETENEE